MMFCCSSKENFCEDFSCKVEKNDKGLIISLSSDDKEKVEALQNMMENAKKLCCCDDKKDDKKSDSCC